MNLNLLDRNAMEKKKSELNTEKEAVIKQKQANITNLLDEKGKRMLMAASEKEASSWLSALPLKSLGYTLNKQEFCDAILS